MPLSFQVNSRSRVLKLALTKKIMRQYSMSETMGLVLLRNSISEYLGRIRKRERRDVLFYIAPGKERNFIML